MKRSGLETTVKETEVDQDHFKVIRFYREKMNQQPLHSALRSFNIQDGVRMSGVYEIHRNNEVSVRIFVDYGLFGNDYLHGEISRDCTRVLQVFYGEFFMAVCGLSLHLGSSESRKTLEQKFIFQIGTLNPHGINERFSFN